MSENAFTAGLREAAISVDESSSAPAAELPDDWSFVDHFELNGKRYFVLATGPTARADSGLSPREHQVASLAKLGYSNKAIAFELGVSCSTVATHLGQVFRKLGVRGRVQLIRRGQATLAPLTDRHDTGVVRPK